MGEEEVEKDIISASPEIVMSKGGNVRRNSTGQAIIRASLSSSNSVEKVLPHYLRASTNSCHDFCKYGRKHAFEAKGKHRIPRKVMGYTETSVEGQEQIKNVNLGDRKKKPLMNLKATPELKIELLETPKIIKQKALPSMKKIEISIKPAIAAKQRSVTAKSPSPSNLSGVASGRSSVNSPLNPSGGLNGRRKSDNIPMGRSGGTSGRKNSWRSPSNSSNGPSGGRKSENHSSSLSGGSLPVRRNNEKKIAQNIGLSKIGEKKPLKLPIASLSPKPSVNRVSSLKPMRYRSLKAVSPMMNRSKARKAEPSYEQIKEKTLYVIEPKPENKSLEPVEHDETINRSSRSSLSLSSLSSCPSLSSDEEEQNDEESESELIEGDITAYKHDKTGKNGAEDSKGGDKRRPRRSAMIHPEDKDSVPQKLKFQRGKVVSLDPENNGPRRLRFRTGRVVSENLDSENSGLKRLKFRTGTVASENLDSDNSGLKRLKFRQGRVVGVNLSGKADIGRRSFKRNKDFGGDVNAAKAGTPTIVLRHQDVHGKKEEQGLFNDVIEETANKLVEARKSKVKALVGAFETVISLQESKPPTTV